MQRLALCRALVYEPDLLLLDEPFSNLDAKLREQMRIELKLLQRRLGITVLFVTHDQIEALSLSDRIAVMQRGRIEQVGPPRHLYEQPGLRVRPRLPRADGDPARAGSADAGGRRRVDHGRDERRARRDGRSPAAPPGHRDARARGRRARRDPARRTSGGPGGRRASGHEHALPGVIEALLFVGDRYEARVALGGEHSILLLLPRTASGARGSACARPSRPRR